MKRMPAREYKARARATRHCWPPLKETPLAPTTVRSPSSKVSGHRKERSYAKQRGIFPGPTVDRKEYCRGW